MSIPTKDWRWPGEGSELPKDDRYWAMTGGVYEACSSCRTRGTGSHDCPGPVVRMKDLLAILEARKG